MMSKPVGIDGKDHIRIHSAAATELGRLLSEFAEIPVRTEYGTFRNLAAYSAFLRYGCVDLELFREMDGNTVVRASKHYTPKFNPDYTKNYRGALYRRVSTNDEILALFVESTLPFVVYEPNNQKIADFYNKIREKLKGVDSMRKAKNAVEDVSAHSSCT